MDTQTLLRNTVAAACLGFLLPAFAATNAPTRAYASDLRMAVKIGDDLYQSLDAKFQTRINPEAVSTVPNEAPAITPIARNAEGKASAQVLISTGYVDLINHIAHAKAIDRIQPGYFQQYVSNLGRATDGNALPVAPNIIDGRYWSDAVMNDQISYFNQMMGITLAINLSHHYLGHYQKYAGQILGGKLAPINNFLSPDEWDASVQAAALNSLDCALAPEGAVALFDAIDKMPTRPAWAAFIVPPDVNIKKLNQQLAVDEKSYFHGGLKLHNPTPDWTGAAPKLVAK
jgi:hypothetical protein